MKNRFKDRLLGFMFAVLLLTALFLGSTVKEHTSPDSELRLLVRLGHLELV